MPHNTEDHGFYYKPSFIRVIKLWETINTHKIMIEKY